MARLRTLKPSFFTHELLAELPPLTRLLFQGLWCHADKAGRVEDRPRFLKTVILPYDDCDVGQMLEALHRAGFIIRYQVAGKRIIGIPKFGAHQKPHRKEPELLPPPVEPDLGQYEPEKGQAEPDLGGDEPGGLWSLVSGELSLVDGEPQTLPPPEVTADPVSAAGATRLREASLRELADRRAPESPLRTPLADAPIDTTDSKQAAYQPRVIEPPTGPPEGWSGSEFWRWAQYIRQKNGFVPEIWPDGRDLSAWWSGVLGTRGVTVARLKEAFYIYGETDYWKPRRYPFQGFKKQWADYMPQEPTHAAR